MYLAEEIGKLFNDNANVWYVPFGNGVNAHGKLHEALAHVKTSLREGFLLKKKSSDDSQDIQNTSVEFHEDLGWLKINISPWHMVTSKWNNTFEERQKELKCSATNSFLYFQYLCTQTDEGKHLVIP